MSEALPPLNIKINQRHKDCDVNAMLLCVFQYLLYFEEDLILEEDFEKNFFKRCLYCGCLSEQSGVKISYIVFPKVSFAVFIHHIKDYFKDDSDFLNYNFMEQIFIDAFNALQNGLNTDEKVIIYDEKASKFALPKMYLKDNDKLKEFLKPLLSMSPKQITRIRAMPDDFRLLNKTLKDKAKRKRSFNFLYTLYDDTEPKGIFSIIKKDQVKFCKRTYRKNFKLCAAKEFLQIIIEANPQQMGLVNVLMEKVRYFLGL